MEKSDSDFSARLATSLQARVPALMAIYVFGSHARGDAHPKSDLDIAILADKPLDPVALFELAGELSTEFGYEVDLVDLAGASTVFRAQVVAEGKRLLCTDPERCETFEDGTFTAYARLNEERRGILDDIQKRGSVHG